MQSLNVDLFADTEVEENSTVCVGGLKDLSQKICGEYIDTKIDD